MSITLYFGCYTKQIAKSTYIHIYNFSRNLHTYDYKHMHVWVCRNICFFLAVSLKAWNCHPSNTYVACEMELTVCRRQENERKLIKYFHKLVTHMLIYTYMYICICTYAMHMHSVYLSMWQKLTQCQSQQ